MYIKDSDVSSLLNVYSLFGGCTFLAAGHRYGKEINSPKPISTMIARAVLLPNTLLDLHHTFLASAILAQCIENTQCQHHSRSTLCIVHVHLMLGGGCTYRAQSYRAQSYRAQFAGTGCHSNSLGSAGQQLLLPSYLYIITTQSFSALPKCGGLRTIPS